MEVRITSDMASLVRPCSALSQGAAVPASGECSSAQHSLKKLLTLWGVSGIRGAIHMHFWTLNFPASFIIPLSTPLFSTRWTLFKLFVFTIFFTVLPSLKSAEFEVSGILAYRSTRGTAESAQYDFSVVCKGNEWLIRLTNKPTGGQGLPNVVSRELGTDGADIYSKLQFSDQALKSSKIANTNKEYAQIRSGGFPEKAHATEKLLWLAFLSGNYFATQPKGPTKIKSLWPGGDSDSYDCEVIMFPGTQALPRSLSILKPGYLVASLPTAPGASVIPRKQKTGGAASREELGTVRIPLKAPFTNGYVACEYRVLQATNIEKWELPIEGQFEFFNVRNGPDQAERYSSELYAIRVHDVRGTTDRTAFLPPVAANVNAVDYRVHKKNGQPVYYEITNSTWITREQAGWSNQVMAVSLPRLKPSPKKASVTRVVLTVLLVASAFVPITILTWNYFQRNKLRNSLEK